MDDRLHDFVRHARSRGLDHTTIRSLLQSAGWKEREIFQAVAEESLEMPVPAPVGAGGSRDAFYYLLTFTGSYVAAFCILYLQFCFVDYLWPEAPWTDWMERSVVEGARWSIASLLVVVPLVGWLSSRTERELRRQTESHSPTIRDWLAFLSMFVAAAVMTGDLVTLVYSFLNGDLTGPFITKSLLLLVVAAVLFAHFLLSLRPIELRQRDRHRRRAVALAALLFIGSALVEGFVLSGSPYSARQLRLDEQRVEHLRSLHRAVQAMVGVEVGYGRDREAKKQPKPLPKSLDEIADFMRSRQYHEGPHLLDPETGQPYVYTVTGETTYELRAHFVKPRRHPNDQFWNHDVGERVFRFDAASPP